MGYWHVIIPEAGTNLFPGDPSFEQGTLGTYWTTAVGGGTGTAALDTTQSFFERTSVLLTPGTAGVNLYQTITTTAADHTLSCYVRRSDGGVVANSDVQAYIDGAATNFDSITLVGRGWYRCVKTATETAADHDTGVRSVTGGTAVYVDGMQFEAKGYATTYMDGEQPSCTWARLKHGSTSTRSAQSRAGGRVRDIDATYGVKTTLMSGYGMPPVQHNTTSYALLPGALLQSMKTQPRELVLTFAAKGTSLANLHSKRDSLIEAFKPDLVSPLQPVRLRYTGNTTEVEIAAHYAGGLEGSLGGGTAEKMAARYIAYDPLWYELGEVAASLTTKLSVSSADYALRKVDGVWAVFGTLDNTVSAIAIHPTTQDVYLGGFFTNAGGLANADYITRWSGTSLNALGTGMNAEVRALVFGPDGTLYAGGAFTSAGGVANTAYIAKWNGSAWSALGTGMNGAVRALAVGTDGTLYAGGSFTLAGGVANTVYVAKWDGSAWSALSTGLGADVYALAVGPDNTLYVGGDFLNAGGDANADRLAKWNGTAFSALGTGANNSVYALTMGPDGTLYAGGVFTLAGGVTNTVYVAKWDGSAWSALSTGMNGTVFALAMGTDGLLYAGGGFTTAGGLALADRLAIWNGTTWVHPDVDLPGSPNTTAIAATATRLYLGYSTAGTAVTSKINTITNGGSRTMYPKLVLKRSGGTTARLEWLKNETTGDTVWLNYSLLDGETLTIDFTPGQKSITSDFFGNVIGRALLPNSDFASFSLLPNANDISFYVSDTGTPTLTAYLLYKNTHHAVDGGA